MLNCSLFQSFVSDPVKQDLILDQFSMITRPYTKTKWLETTTFPAAHARVANIWEHPPFLFPPPQARRKPDKLLA